jgi:acyltransferase-like protein
LLSDGARETQVEALTRINISEFIEALGLGHVRRGRSVLERLCRPAARRIASDMAQFDAILGDRGLHSGANEVLAKLVKRLEVTGVDRVPRDAPLLIAANHPGLGDVLAILATLDRADLRIVAAEYPLLRALRGVNRHFIYVPRERGRRLRVLHEILTHLRSGGAVLLLPAGNIEPDPAVRRDAVTSLESWSASIGLIARRVQHLCVVPAVVSGVLLRNYQRHPLIWIRRRAADRQQLGATLQVLARASSSATVRLAYGPPLTSEALFATGRDARAATRVVVEHTRRLMQHLSPNDHLGGIPRFGAAATTDLDRSSGLGTQTPTVGGSDAR